MDLCFWEIGGDKLSLIRAISAEYSNWGGHEKRMGGKNLEVATIVDYFEDFCRSWGKFWMRI